MEQLVITKPDDWHLHLRDDAAMASVVAQSAQFFKRAMVMPNLSLPVTTLSMAQEYRDRILRNLPASAPFEPWMTLYLTGATTPETIKEASECGFVLAVKLYPAGVTTNASLGVSDLHQVERVLETMQQLGMPLSVHGEVPDEAVDIFDRERVFVEREMSMLTKRYPELKIVFEHISTKEAVAFVEEAPATVAATITPHHLYWNRNQMLSGGINPHAFCFPILKNESDRLAVLKAALSGNPKFFLGTDSAPHNKIDKENGRGKGGIFNTPVALSVYTQCFEQADGLDRLEAFTSLNGADFYGLPHNRETITLKKKHWEVPRLYPFGDGWVVPMLAGQTLDWSVEDES